jgi:hypothetical protein
MKTLHFPLWRGVILTVVVLVMSSLAAWAQVSSYTFRSETGTAFAYVPLSAGTLLGAGAGLNGEYYDNVPIGFSFTFDNVNFTTVGISANGYLVFGGRQSFVNFPRPLRQAFDEGTVSACGTSLRGSANAAIRTQVTGTAPNRTFIVQWQNLALVQFSNVVPTDIVNFQIRLDESTNVVSMSYGATILAENTAFDVAVGLRAGQRSGEDFSMRQVEPVTDRNMNP